MSLFETSGCPAQTKPELTPRVPEDEYPDCDARCDAIGLRDPCIDAPGCGWCAATGRCLSGSVFGGPCKFCPHGWASRYGELPCRPGYGGEAEARAGGSCRECKCENGGTCTPSGDCLCPANQTGVLCQKPKTRVDACNGNGDWDFELDDCVCDEGFVGVGDDRCAFECDPVGTCNGKGYCSELTGRCVCDVDAAGERCECAATPLTTYPFADPLKNEATPGCCAFGFEPCPASSANAGRCVLAPANADKCPVFREDNTTLVILVVLALLVGGYLAAATIAYFQSPPQPSCTIVVRLPEVLVLREVLFKRSELDTKMKQFVEVEVPLVHNFWRVKRMVCRRLKSQPDPEDIVLTYLGSELKNKWRLIDGIQCGDTVHVKATMKNKEVTEYVRKRERFWARVRAYLTEDNIVAMAYFFGVLVLVVALAAWPGDPSGDALDPPPPPPPAPFAPPPMVVDMLSPPPPPTSPTAPPPPPAAWVAVELAQNSVVGALETSGEFSTIVRQNETIPEYLLDAAGPQNPNSTYDDVVSFTRTESDDGSQLFYVTHEDAILWVDQLPQFFDADGAPFAAAYRTGCFPNLAAQYDMSDTGVISYQPEPDVSGQDFMTYYGLVAESVAVDRGLIAADLVDCDNKIEDLCVTNTVLANILIEPRNDAPIAANGEPVLYFTSAGDFITMNDVQDAETRNGLDPPFRLIRELVGYDADGDLLKYSVSVPPMHGHAEIIEENRFFYVPEPGFAGSDHFEYVVDDSRSNPPEHVRYDVAHVVVQVGSADGLPDAAPASYWVDEDAVLEGRLYRTPALLSLLPTLSYRALTQPSHGDLEILCGGGESANASSCAYEAGFGHFRYSPEANFHGVDAFVFGVESSDYPGQVFNATVNVTVRPVNDVPVVQDLTVEAIMNRDKNVYSFADADVTTITIPISDSDDQNFTAYLHKIGGPTDLHGRFFTRLDGFGRPTDEVPRATLAQTGVFVTGGQFQAYYMAPPLMHGVWTERYAVRARDGDAVSAPATLTINVKCAPGFVADEDAFGNALTDLAECTACAPGSVSSGLDATVCSKCPIGMHSGDGLVGQCALCPVGTYADVEGSVFCEACPLGSTSSLGAISIDECYCAVGYYGTPGNCRPCPNLGRWGEMGKWTYCAEENLEVPLPQPGFYVVRAADPTTEPVSVRQCFPDVSCPGLNVPAADDKVDMIALGDASADEAQCRAGYTNEGCDTCVDGYFRLNSRCEECPPTWQPVLYGFFMIGLILFAAVGPWVINESSATYLIVVSAMNVITYSQEVGVFGRYFLHWDEDPNMRGLLKWAFLFQLNPEILALECTQNVDFTKRWRSMMALPAILALIMFACLIAYFVWVGGQLILVAEDTFAIRRLQKVWVGCGRSVLSLAVVMYSGLTVATLDMFIFHTSVTDGREYLRAAPALRFGLMHSSETWFQLLPGAVFALVMYPVAMLLSVCFAFYYVSGQFNKLWVRDLLGWSSYSYRDEFFWYRCVEMLRFLCLATIQLIAYEHDEAGGLSQALAALVVVAVSMSLLINRPYKRYRKKLLEFTILFSHGLVLLMSSLNLAPTTTEITATNKAQFRDATVATVVLTYLIIWIDVLWSAIEELPVAQRLETFLIVEWKRFVTRVYEMAKTPPPAWVNTPEFDEDEPVRSIFRPSVAACLIRMRNLEDKEGVGFENFEERALFARSVHSLLKHRLIIERLSRRDVGNVFSYEQMFQEHVKTAMMMSAALEDAEHNRLVMAFTEKRLLRATRMTHLKFYKRVKKKLVFEGLLNPLLDAWLRENVEGLEFADGQDQIEGDLLSTIGTQLIKAANLDTTPSGSRGTSRQNSRKKLSGLPGPVTEAREDGGPGRSLRFVAENREGGGEQKPTSRRGNLRSGASRRGGLNAGASRKGGFFASLDDHGAGRSSSFRVRRDSAGSRKPSPGAGGDANPKPGAVPKPKPKPKPGANAAQQPAAPLVVDPKRGEADVAKSAYVKQSILEDDVAIDLDFEAEVFTAREYEGKVHFLRKEGYFDDLHQEWDKLDEKNARRQEIRDRVDDPTADDVEGGSVLPWHFMDVEEDPPDVDPPPAEIVVPDDPTDPTIRERFGDEFYDSRKRTVVVNTCCIHIHKPGETCSHGHKMPDPEYYTEVIERDFHETRESQMEMARRTKRVEVPVRLNETSETVRARVFDEMQHAREQGVYDDDGGEGAPEVLNLRPNQINLVYKGAAVREPTTMAQAMIQWKADVTLQGKRGGAGRSLATLVLRDDLGELERKAAGQSGERSHTVVHTHSKTVINNNTTRKERVRELAGFGHGADRLKQSQTVRTLREAAAEANGLPFERTILRYRYAREGKELINDAATLERKKLASIDDVHISEEPQTPYYVYREVRANWTFFDSVFRTYASLDVLESETTAGDDVFAGRTSVTTQVRMSEDQFVRAFARCDLHVKLSNAQYGGSEQALRTVFRAVKDAIAEAEQMTLSDLDGVGELFGALAPSELSRLARRVKHPDGLALDEFVTAVVLLAWMTYGFRVPRSWDRGVARALRFFVERVMRPNVPEMHESHAVVLQFAAARKAEGASASASKEALVAFRHFSFNASDGMSLEQWIDCVEWLAKNDDTKRHATLIFRTHVAPAKGEPAWVEEGCREGRVAPIATDDSERDASLLTRARFLVAFGELCFRDEAAEGGTPSVRQIRAFRRAMQRWDITRRREDDPPEEVDLETTEKVVGAYDQKARVERIVVEKETVREIHHHHHHREEERERETVRDRPRRRRRREEKRAEDNASWAHESSSGESESEPDFGEAWVPPKKPSPPPTAMSTRSSDSGASGSSGEWRDPFEEAKERDPPPRVNPRGVVPGGEKIFAEDDRSAEAVASRRRRRVVKKTVTTTQTTTQTTKKSAKAAVVSAELEIRRKKHRAENIAFAQTGVLADLEAIDARFRAEEEESTDEDERSEDEEIGTEAWERQQERRRSRYRVVTAESDAAGGLYDFAGARAKREKLEREQAEHERKEREKREALEAKWRQEAERKGGNQGGFLARGLRRFTERIETGWTKEYAEKSTGLTAKNWERV